jgi:tRNA-binding protein
MSGFISTEIRVGQIIDIKDFKEAKKPAFKLWIDFGPSLGVKKSSAQLTGAYTPETLLGKYIVAVTNLEPRQIGPFISEVLVLGVNGGDENEIFLLVPEKTVKLGSRVH